VHACTDDWQVFLFAVYTNNLSESVILIFPGIFGLLAVVILFGQLHVESKE